MLNIDQIQGKKVLLRADLDLALGEPNTGSFYRLEALIPTLKFCLQHAQKTCLIGHMGRPKGPQPELSLKPLVKEIKRLINKDIGFIDSGFSPGDWWKGEDPLTLLENIRFDSREESLNLDYARQLASGADIYIYEAFATYRPCTSLSLIPKLLPTVTGFRFDTEINTLKNLLEAPSHPTLLIASGAKLDKLEIIKDISGKFDQTFLGGKFANSVDLNADGFDLNDAAISRLRELIKKSSTVVFNGPVGKYEDQDHQKGTLEILKELSQSSAFTIIGGGDTLATIPQLGFTYTQYGFVSTGGGAMLNFLQTNSHPLLEMLN